MPPTKILVVSDAVSTVSGLARITRDLCWRMSDMPDVDVASFGYGGCGDPTLPFREYHANTIDNWVLPELAQVWEMHSEGQPGVIMFIWDASRLAWFADPQYCPTPMLRGWLEKAKIKKWLYGAIDAEGPNGNLSCKLQQIYKGFDRVLNYSHFSAEVTGYPDHLPHGIETNVFKPMDRRVAKRLFAEGGFVNLKPTSFLIGIIATNQERKDWALGFQTARLLLDRGRDVMLWCHVDTVVRHWDLGAMVVDFGLEGRICITTSKFPDPQIAGMISACDVTLGIGMGEGFGYPIFESLACGVPCVHGSYGGAAEHLPPHYTVEPENWRFEGPFTNLRPVFRPIDWADQVDRVVGELAGLPDQLDWNNLWPKWEEWIRKGL